MRILLLGTTGYHPNDHRHTACMMFPELGLVLDAGTGMYRVRDHLRTSTLDIFLTHAHLDHVIGLTFLFDVLYGKEMEHVRVHALPDKIAALREHLFAEALFPVAPPFDWVELETEPQLADGGRMSHFALPHPGGSLGYRIDWPDRSMAYVTDTVATPDADYIEKIRGVDVLLHECYFPDEWKAHAELTGHSWTSAVAQIAKAADVGRLVLVHVNPLSKELDPVGLPVAQEIFAETVIAADEMVIDF